VVRTVVKTDSGMPLVVRTDIGKEGRNISYWKNGKEEYWNDGRTGYIGRTEGQNIGRNGEWVTRC
jgi:hypothetical protein